RFARRRHLAEDRRDRPGAGVALGVISIGRPRSRPAGARRNRSFSHRRIGRTAQTIADRARCGGGGRSGVGERRGRVRRHHRSTSGAACRRARPSALLPASACGRAILLLLADTFARTIAAPAELPIGIVTALIGAPFFLLLLLSRRPRLVA